MFPRYHLCIWHYCASNEERRVANERSGMAACPAGVCDDLTSGALLCHYRLTRQSCYMFLLLPFLPHLVGFFPKLTGRYWTARPRSTKPVDERAKELERIQQRVMHVRSWPDGRMDGWRKRLLPLRLKFAGDGWKMEAELKISGKEGHPKSRY